MDLHICQGKAALPLKTGFCSWSESINGSAIRSFLCRNDARVV